MNLVAAPAAWLREPWAGAMIRFIADPLDGLDWSDEPVPLPGWPRDIPVSSVLADPAARRRLARWLLPDEASAALIAACTAVPPLRLALVPEQEATRLMARAAAWWDAPDLARQLRRSEVEAARAALGETAHAFALRGAALLPRPSSALGEALAGLATAPGEPRRGAALFGLALGAGGAVPGPMLDRLGLRRPAALWAEVIRRADGDAAGEVPADALAALRRLSREGSPSWSRWSS